MVPPGDHTRPTADRVREAIFNSLYSLGALDGATVVDAFAGSGALGIEALSRGAAHCTFVENDRAALGALRDNLSTLGLDDDATVVEGDGATALRRLGGAVDLVLLDPPYAFTGWPALLACIHDAVVVIESDRSIPLLPGWVVHRERSYGTTVVTLAEAPTAAADEGVE